MSSIGGCLQQDARFAPGTKITILGLTGRKNLNNTGGVVLSTFPGTDGVPRYQVRLDGGEEEVVALRPQNMRPFDGSGDKGAADSPPAPTIPIHRESVAVDPRFTAGSKIIIVGLTGRIELNGAEGVVVSAAPGLSGVPQYQISIDGSEEVVQLRPQNMRPAGSAATAAPSMNPARTPETPPPRGAAGEAAAGAQIAGTGAAAGALSTAGAEEVAALRLRLAALEGENIALREERNNWRHLLGSLINKAVLSPDYCEFFKRTVRLQLGKALGSINHEVDYIDCSFPSAASNAPRLQLLSASGGGGGEGGWEEGGGGGGGGSGGGGEGGDGKAAAGDVGRSLWKLSWRPNWSVQASCRARKAGLPYSVQLKVLNFEVHGILIVTVSGDASQFSAQFEQAPDIRMTLQPAISLGPQVCLLRFGASLHRCIAARTAHSSAMRQRLRPP